MATGSLTALSPATIATGTTPVGMSISSDGLFAYQTNYGSNSVSQYSRNTTTGLLTALSPATIATGTNPRAIVISSDSTFAYVSNYGSSNISQYSRNTTTGLLTALSPATIATGTNPSGLTLSPDSNFVYSSNTGASTVSQYSRNPTTGLLTALSPATIATGTSPYWVLISPDGLFAYTANYGSNNVSQFSRDASTGLLTALSPATIATGAQPNFFTITPDGLSIYVVDNGAGVNTLHQYSRNPTTGLLTALSPATIATGTNPQGIVSNDSSVYVCNYASNTLHQYSRNPTTGLLTALSPATIATGTAPYQVIISPDGKSVYVSNVGGNTISQYSRDTGVIGTTYYQNAETAATSTALRLLTGDKKVLTTSTSISTKASDVNATKSTSVTTTSTFSRVATYLRTIQAPAIALASKVLNTTFTSATISTATAFANATRVLLLTLSATVTTTASRLINFVYEYFRIQEGTSVSYSIDDGLTWNTATTPNAYTAVAHGPDHTSGTNIHWVGMSGTDGVIANSLDGFNWTTVDTINHPWTDVVWTGTQFCACASDGAIYTSPTGVTWTQRTPATGMETVNNRGVHHALGTLVITSNGTNGVQYSTDGITWTKSTLPITDSFVDCVWNGTVWIVISGDAGSNTFYTSPDLITWTARTVPLTGPWGCICVDPVSKIAVATLNTNSNECISSTDGINWTARSLPNTDNWGVGGIAHDGHVFVMTGNGSKKGAWSADGINWTGTDLSFVGTWTSKMTSSFSAWKQLPVSALTTASAFTSRVNQVNKVGLASVTSVASIIKHSLISFFHKEFTLSSNVMTKLARVTLDATSTTTSTIQKAIDWVKEMSVPVSANTSKSVLLNRNVSAAANTTMARTITFTKNVTVLATSSISKAIIKTWNVVVNVLGDGIYRPLVYHYYQLCEAISNVTANTTKVPAIMRVAQPISVTTINKAIGFVKSLVVTSVSVTENVFRALVDLIVSFFVTIANTSILRKEVKVIESALIRVDDVLPNTLVRIDGHKNTLIRL